MLSKFVRKELEKYNTCDIAKTVNEYLNITDGSQLSREDADRFWKLFKDRKNAELIFLICDAYKEKGYNEY